MVKHKAWATTIVAPKLVGSITTKGQMQPTCRVSLTASQAGENSQSHAPEHTIVSSILTDLIFKRNLRRRTALSVQHIDYKHFWRNFEKLVPGQGLLFTKSVKEGRDRITGQERNSISQTGTFTEGT